MVIKSLMIGFKQQPESTKKILREIAKKQKEEWFKDDTRDT